MEDGKKLFKRLVEESKKSPSVAALTQTVATTTVGAPFWQGWTSAVRSWIEDNVSEVIVILIILIFLLFSWNTLLCFSTGRRAKKKEQGESEAGGEA